MMRLEEEFKHMYVEEPGMEYSSEAWILQQAAEDGHVFMNKHVFFSGQADSHADKMHI